MNAVSYPAEDNDVASVRESSKEPYPNCALCHSTPWLWGYIPVRNEARAGQQSGKEENECANVTPSAATRRRRFGVNARSSARMSSAITTTMFGRSGGASARAGSGALSADSARSASRSGATHSAPAISAAAPPRRTAAEVREDSHTP